MPDNQPSVQIGVDGVLRGARDMAPLGLFVAPFGMAFGAAAIGRGVEPEHAVWMSALVYAGASQFAALSFWSDPIALGPLLLAVFAVNARHILLGAALYPWMRGLPPLQRYAAAAAINDASWAYAVEKREAGECDVGVLVGGGAVMWVIWVSSTLAGAVLAGGGLDMKALALDTVMAAFFMTVIVGMAAREKRAIAWAAPWAAAAITALIAATWGPPGWHVVAGSLAGGLVGAILHRDAPELRRAAA